MVGPELLFSIYKQINVVLADFLREVETQSGAEVSFGEISGPTAGGPT